MRSSLLEIRRSLTLPEGWEDRSIASFAGRAKSARMNVAKSVEIRPALERS